MPPTNPKHDKARLLLPILYELYPRGDGSALLKPVALPDPATGDTWIDLDQAAALLNINPRQIKDELLGVFLIHYRPTPRTCNILLQSLLRLKDALQEADFWDDPALQKPVREWVAQQRRNRLAPARKLL